MSRTPFVLAAAFGLGLAALGGGHGSAEAAPPADPPSLWSIKQTHDDGSGKVQFICAGAVIRQGFARAMPQANGQPCALVNQTEAPAGVFNARCRLGTEFFHVHSVTDGDVSQDFTVKSGMQEEASAGRRFLSNLHYHKVLAACPAGWNDGDTGSPGDRTVVNAISRASHPVSPAVPAR
jgi:hypothetical protein